MNDLTDTELREKILKHTQKGTWIALEEIDVSQMTRPYNAEVVAALATSIRAIGLQHMLTCVERDGKPVLVAGRNRLEALRIIGAEKAPCRIVDFDDTEAKLWRLSENLHRAELTKLQYDLQIVEFAELLKARRAEPAAQPEPGAVSVQVEHKPQGGRPEGGISKAARELSIPAQTVRRAYTTASLSPAAQHAAEAKGLDDNRAALHTAARQPTSEAQVAEIERIAERKAEPKYDVTSPPNLPAATAIAHPLRNLINISGGALARWIKTTTPNDRAHVIRVLRMAADILDDETREAA